MRKPIIHTILFLLFAILLLPILQTVSAQESEANLRFDPASQTTGNGDITSVTIYLDTGGEDVNRVLATINYPPNLLSPQSIDTSGSFVDLWYQNNIGDTDGQIALDGGVSDSISGSDLLFAKINFEAQSTGSAEITFAETSEVYRAEDNTDILGTTQSATVNIVSSETTPSPTPTPTPTLSASPTSTTPQPTSEALPNSGTTTPTLIFMGLAAGITLSGIFLLRKT